MKKLLLMVAAMMAFVACGSEEPFMDISSELATSISPVQQAGGEFTFSIESNEAWTITTEGETWYSFDKMEGKGSAEVTVTVEENYSTKPRSATFTIATSSVAAKTFNIMQMGATASASVGELLIEEIFYTKNLVESTGQPDNFAGDQYIKITNTTDHVVYADRLAIGESYIFTDAQSIIPTSWNPDKRPTHCPVGVVFVIPGDGDDYPIEAGGSILVAAGAQDYTTANPNSMDLSIADFEWYDQSTDDAVIDVDNPEVTNVEIWFTPSLTLTWFNQQGNKGYVIAYIPEGVTAESFLEDYKWEGTVAEDWSEWEMGIMEDDITNAYLFPNEWVLDAVNISHETIFTNLAFDATLDAGYTYCGETTTPAARCGKSVLRKRDASGKLVDTNNSTVDFTPSATPTVPTGNAQ